MLHKFFNILYVHRYLVLFFIVLQTHSVNAQENIEGEYIIKFKKPIVTQQQASKLGTSIQALASKLANQRGEKVLAKFSQIKIKNKIVSAEIANVKISSSQDLELLKLDADVEYIEPNLKLYLDPREGYQKRDMSQPNLSSFQNQDDSNLEAAGVAADGSETYSQSSINTQVLESWSIQTAAASGSTKVIVAVIDSGVDTEHFMFKDSNGLFNNSTELNGQSGVDDDGNGFIDDFYGWNFITSSNVVYDDNDHGTHVAGIVLGVGQDIMKVPILESKIKILPLKFLDANGAGSTSNAIAAIYYAVNNGAKVINNSWGGTAYSRALHDAYKFAYDHDVVIVTAAGNSNYNLDTTPIYPAALDAPSNIAVAATALNGSNEVTKASFSNYSSSLVHVFAPGYSIRSTVPGKYSAPSWAGGTDTNYCDDANSFITSFCFYRLSGTSMASPFVAGLAALLRRENSNLSAYETKQIILNTAQNYTLLNGYVSTSGQVNAYLATQSALGYVRSIASSSPDYTPSYKAEETTTSSGGDSGGSSGGCGLVKVIADNNKNFPGGMGGGSLSIIFILMSLPFALVYYFKTKNKKELNSVTTEPAFKRRFERYNLSQNVIIKLGDQLVSCASQTISVGGLAFKSDVKFETGQKIKISLQQGLDDVEGEIVWSTETKSFGVRFNEISDSITQHVQSLVSGLQPC